MTPPPQPETTRFAAPPLRTAAHDPAMRARRGRTTSSARGRVPAMTIPAGQQAEGPSIARVYDYLLGGSHNFAADQEAAGEFLARWPDARETMRSNRAFLGRAVRYLASQAGIRQFLDIGSGIPTMGNVHEIAQQTAPDARVAYVDNEEVAVLHSRAILARNQNATAIQADLRRPGEILRSPQLRDLLDLSRPVALLLVAVLHFFPDSDEPAALVAELREALAPGSYVVISHGTTDGQAPGVAEAMGHYNQTTAPFQPRSHSEVMAFFDGLEIIDPGPGARPPVAARPAGEHGRSSPADRGLRRRRAQAMTRGSRHRIRRQDDPLQQPARCRHGLVTGQPPPDHRVPTASPRSSECR